jgi:uncharacterized repeat protein (TIGR01451 family)
MNNIRTRLAIVAVLIMAVFLILYGGGRVLAAPNDTNVCGHITTDSAWTPGGSPYILTCNVIVDDNVTLTVAPGTTVRGGDSTVLMIQGTMNAIGTPMQPITFTSVNHAPGDWAGIRFDGSSDYDGRGTLDYVTIQNGGYLYNNNSTDLGIKHTNDVTVTNSIVENTAGYGIYVEDGSALLENLVVRNNSGAGLTGALGGAMAVWNSNFTGNGSYPIRVEARYVTNVAGNTFSGNGLDRVLVYASSAASSQKVSQNSTWSNSNQPAVYETDGILEVLDDVTLTLDPGVTMLFEADFGVRIYGTMNAIGTPAQAITFTSIADSAAGEWGGIRFDGSGSYEGRGTFEYVTVRNGGDTFDSVSTNLAVKHDGVITVSNSVVEDTSGTGIYVEDALAWLEDLTVRNNSNAGISGALGGEMTVQNCECTDNGRYPIRVEARYADNLTNNTFTNNEHDRIYVYTSSSDSNKQVSRDSTWSNSNHPAIYEIGGTLEVVDDVTLTVQPDVTMLFQNNQGAMIYGSVTAVGTITQPITFTSVISGAGQWGGLRFNGDGADDGHGRLEHVIISNGGDYLDSASVNLSVKHSDVFTLSHSLITNSRRDGIYVEDSSPIWFEDTTIRDNSRDGMRFAAGNQGTIQSCQIMNNGQDGIYIANGATNLTITGTQIISNTNNGVNHDGNGDVVVHYSILNDNGGSGIVNNNTSCCLDATYNDWGSSDGPNDVSAVDDGCMGAVANASDGDNVSDDVYYYPWLQTGTTEVEQLWSITQTVTSLAGGTLSYTISVSNSFPAALRNATLVDGIPAHTTFVTGSDSPAADATAPMRWENRSISGLQQYRFGVEIDDDAGGQTITNQACLQLPGQDDLCSESSIQSGYFLYLPLIVNGSSD